MNRAEQFLSYMPDAQRPTRAAVSAALDRYIKALDTAKPRAKQPRKQLTPQPRKEIKNVSRRTADDIRTANEMALLMADVTTAKGSTKYHRPSENVGAVEMILKKASEPPTTELGTPIVPGHHQYVAPAPTYSDRVAGPTSQGFDRSIQNPMKGWSTLDAARYRNRKAAETENERKAELERLRIR